MYCYVKQNPSFFEQKGVELQESASTIREAIRRFRYSCQLCSERGRMGDCESCPIANVHEVHVDVLRFLEEERLAKAYAAERATERPAPPPCRPIYGEPAPCQPSRRSCEEPVIPHPVCLTIVI